MGKQQVQNQQSLRESVSSIPPSPAKAMPTESESEKQAKLEAQRRELELLKQK